VTATSPGRALAIANDDLRRLMQLSPKIETKIRQSLEQRLAPEMVERLTFWIGETPKSLAPEPPSTGL
jgi:CRP-like cAMP-binding protein